MEPSHALSAPTAALAPCRHFLQFRDLNAEELTYLFGRTRLIKEKFKRYQPHHILADRTLVMIFEKASTRTRLSLKRGCISWAAQRSTSTRATRNSAEASLWRTPER